MCMQAPLWGVDWCPAQPLNDTSMVVSRRSAAYSRVMASDIVELHAITGFADLGSIWQALAASQHRILAGKVVALQTDVS